MTEFVGLIATVALMIVGLAVLIGRLKADDALTRIGVFVLVITIMPSVIAFIGNAMPSAAKIAIVLAILVVLVTGFMRLLSRLD